MAEHNFKHSIPARLHPKLETAKKLMIMDVDMGTDMFRFEGELNVEAMLGPSETAPNGMFHYDEAKSIEQLFASYHRDMEGSKAQLVRINFAENPDPDAKQLGYYESFQPIPTLEFISGASGPGAFIRAPKE